jgi:hypothetical protein
VVPLLPALVIWVWVAIQTPNKFQGPESSLRSCKSLSFQHFMEPEGWLLCSQLPSASICPDQINPVLTTSSCFLRIQHHIILPPLLRSALWPLSFLFSNQTFISTNAFFKTTVHNNVSVLGFIVHYLLNVSASIGGHLQVKCTQNILRWPLCMSTDLSSQTFICFPPLLHSCYMPCTFHPLWLRDSNYVWIWLKVMELLIMQFAVE